MNNEAAWFTVVCDHREDGRPAEVVWRTPTVDVDALGDNEDVTPFIASLLGDATTSRFLADGEVFEGKMRDLKSAHREGRTSTSGPLYCRQCRYTVRGSRERFRAAARAVHEHGVSVLSLAAFDRIVRHID